MNAPINTSIFNQKNLSFNNYWNNKLKNLNIRTTLFPLTFSSIKPRLTWESTSFKIEGELYNELLKITKGSDISIYIVLITIIKLLIYKYTQNEDIVVLSSKSHDCVKLNIEEKLPLRDVMKANLSNKELLLKVKNTVVEGFKNQEGVISQAVNKELAVSSTIECSLNTLSTIKETPERKENVLFNFDRNSNKILCKIVFNSVIYDLSSINYFGSYFLNALQFFLKDIDAPISRLDIMSSEVSPIKFEHFSSDGKENLFLNKFQKHVDNSHNKIAVISSDAHFSYGFLNHQSIAISNKIKQTGIEKNSIVAVQMKRSPELVMSLLGILRLGCSYLPLDSGYPLERIKYILLDSAVKLVLYDIGTISEEYKNFLSDSHIDLIEINNTPLEICDCNYPSIRENDPAYIIYTSGTTGYPKGTIIDQGALGNYLNFASRQYFTNNNIKSALATSISFDLTVTCLFGTLYTGNTLEIISDEDLGIIVAEDIISKSINLIKVTPSHLRIILQSFKLMNSCKMDNTCKCIIVGGEALEYSLAADMTKFFSSEVQIYNEYGPTEATVGCIINQFDFTDNIEKFVPIGGPIQNTQVYLMDRNLNNLPIGCLGEIFLSGNGIFKGYLNNPEKTHQCFYKKTEEETELLYRTGDLGWIRSNNYIQYVGRKDSQIKINGFRIELKEIETIASKNSHIQQSVVCVKQDKTGQEHICFYYIPSSNIAEKELREFFLKYLPEFMVPSFYLAISYIPLTINGKLDIKQLPLPFYKKNCVIDKPENDIEVAVKEIWQEVLEIEDISVTSNFFEIGGTSSKLIMLSSKINELLSDDIPITTYFQYSNIRTFTSFILNQEYIDLGKVADEKSILEKKKKSAIDKRRNLLKNFSNE